MLLGTFSRFISHSSFYRPYRSYTSRVSTTSDKWQTIIGLEIHAQLKTKYKLFSDARTSWEELPNQNVTGFDAAFPGTLPYLNRKGVHLALMTALALNCSINPRSTFDRKHYFYHDIPSSYQITQHYNPLASCGQLSLSPLDSGIFRDFSVGIQQIQLEQDTAKTTRTREGVTIDLNRAGVGLMEIVTDADMRSPEEAGAFLKKLQSILRRLGASDGDMEKGSLRVDANISIHREGEEWGTRCEIKNLNTVRGMMVALDFERKRHIAFRESHPGQPVRQETRGFNEAKGETYTLRVKEDAEDYRYMPDPNVPPIIVLPSYLEQLESSLPELPDQSRARLTKQYGISVTDVDTLLGMDDVDGAGIEYFEKVVKESGRKSGKRAVNWIAHELLGQLAAREVQWTPYIVSISELAELVELVENKEITGTAGKALLKHLIDSPQVERPSVSSLIDKLCLRSSATDVVDLCRQAIEQLPKEAESVRKGNERVLMRLVGQVMKLSGGTADAQKARTTLMDLLKG